MKRNAVISLNHKQKEQTVTRTTKWRLSYLVQCYSGSHFTNGFNIVIKMENYLCCNVVPCKKILWGSLCQNLVKGKMKCPLRTTTTPTPNPTPPIFFNISLFQVAFLILFFFRYLFSWLSSGWSVSAVCGSISVRELFKYTELLLTDVELPSPMTSQLNGCQHFFF